MMQALIIEDKNADAFIARQCLTDCGFQHIVVAPSALRGVEYARTMLGSAQPAVPTLILLDMLLPHPSHPALEGRTVAATLTSEMEAGSLHPAHIVAITSEPTPDREKQAYIAGCNTFLSKPMTYEIAEQLRILTQQPAIIGSTENSAARRIIKQDAAALLHLLSQIETSFNTQGWTEKQARALLIRPATMMSDWDNWIAARGGLSKVQERLQTIPLPPELQEMLRCVLRYGKNWNATCETIHISRAEYYNRLRELVVIVCDFLNSWQA
jgi:CheY-like chemotaxis protein